MLEPRPTRRDPRILALLPQANGWTYAVLDAWDVRGVGTLARSSLSGSVLTLERLRIQTAPSALLLVDSRTPGALVMRLAAGHVARRSGLPIARLSSPRAAVLIGTAPGAADLLAAYPELGGVLTDTLVPVARLAAAALTSLTFPSRRYAPRLAARTASAVVSPRARRDREARSAHGSAARRPAG